MANANNLKSILAVAPGWIVFGMTAVWLGPFCIVHLIRFPLYEYWNSHLLYGILFGVSILCMFILNRLELANGYWARSGSSKKTLIICGGYALTMLTGLTVILLLDTMRVMGYYKGDASGSPGMLILPSIVFYCVVGIIFIGFSSIIRRFRQ